MSLRAVVLIFAVIIVLPGCLTAPNGDDDPDRDPNEDPGKPDSGSVLFGSPATATIRPGASLGGYCTFNWVFVDDAGAAYIGTAGHCTEEVGERVVLGSDGAEIGTVVYDSDIATGADTLVDFSLIRLDEDRVNDTHPRMLGWDGPVGTIAAGDASPGDELAFFGHGAVLGEEETTRPRSGVLVDEDGKRYRADMPAVYGDSGSPLIHLSTGKAFGIISQFAFTSVPPSTDTGPIMPFIITELAKGGFAVTVALDEVT